MGLLAAVPAAVGLLLVRDGIRWLLRRHRKPEPEEFRVEWV